MVNSESSKSKIRVTGKTATNGNSKDSKIAAPLKYLSNFWRTYEIPSINCETNVNLTWSKDYVISSATGETKFAVADTKLNLPVVNLSMQDNIEQLK